MKEIEVLNYDELIQVSGGLPIFSSLYEINAAVIASAAGAFIDGFLAGSDIF